MERGYQMFRTKVFSQVLLGLVFLSGISVSSSHALMSVDLELSLLVDVSGSIDATEFNLQKTGYVNAFNDAAIVTAIQNGSLHSIAANLVYWSGSAQQQEAVAWTLINDATSATNFASAINAAARPFSGSTAPGSAINFADPLFFSNDFDGTRLVIDISSDGEQNVGASTSAARDNAFSHGIGINALAIGNQSLLDWYNANAVTPGGFGILANDFDAFESSVKSKLAREIGGDPVVPEPTSMLLLGAGMMGFIGLRRKK